jgi:predicted dehydrogenase
MCGFVERFNAAWIVAEQQMCGEPTAIHAVRHSPAGARDGSGVVTDLMIHDLDLVTSLVGSPPMVKTCLPIGAQRVDVELEWNLGGSASLSASRDAINRRRVVCIECETGRVEVDLLSAHVTVARSGSAGLEHFDCVVQESSLSRQLSHFVALVEGDVDANAERASIVAPHELAYVIEHVADGLAIPLLADR